MSRKDTLRAMFTRRDELPPGNPPDEEAKPPPHVRAGAVGAMGRSLGQIAGAAEQARALIASGAAVIEIAPDRLDPSFIADRLPDEGPDYRMLVAAIRESGQRSPILVRPHPEVAERYQIVFGHRRARALAELGRPVRAVVQSIADDELVVIQGQENSARTDLSYIERALFALGLERRGFDRTVIMAALSMEKTQLSRLLSIAHAIPEALARAIGPAPKAGRPRWAALADRLGRIKNRASLDALLASAAFRAADSDARFARVFAALAPDRGAPKQRISVVKGEDGRRIATIAREVGQLSIVVSARDAPDFGDYLAARIGEIHRAFRDGKEDDM